MNGNNAPIAIKIHDEQSGKTEKNKDIEAFQDFQKIHHEQHKEKMRPSGLEDNNLKISDPLNSVTTLNFQEIRNEIGKVSPKNQNLMHIDTQKMDEKRSKNEQQQSQAAQTGNKSAGTHSSQPRLRTYNETNEAKQPRDRYKVENEVVKLEQIGDLSEIVKEEKTINETIDNQRMQDSTDNVNNTTEMIMELADRNFESLNSHESIKNNRNPPPSAQ